MAPDTKYLFASTGLVFFILLGLFITAEHHQQHQSRVLAVLCTHPDFAKLPDCATETSR